MRASPVILLLALALVGGSAAAWETDQLTQRATPLRDSAWIAELAMDTVVAQAVERTNARTGCRMGEADTRRVLAEELDELTATAQLAEGRSPLRRFGYGRYDAWLEGDPGDQHVFDERQDIFGGLRAWQSVVLRAAGPCDTARLDDTLLGVDKIGHFFALGYDYFRRSRWGEDPERALRWGTRTERTYFGLLTSKAFSYADLAANWEGYRFYAGLLTEGSVVELGPTGCAVQVRGWDWSEWVNWELDEVLNPSVFTSQVQRGVSEHLQENRQEVCAEYAIWGEGYTAHLADVLAAGAPRYVLGRHPERVDPFQLDALCGGLAP